MHASTVLTVVPEKSVTGIGFDKTVTLDIDTFERLAAVFFAELERRFR